MLEFTENQVAIAPKISQSLEASPLNPAIIRQFFLIRTTKSRALD